MIGVTSYAGPCRVCEHPSRERITAGLRAYVGARAISKDYPDLTYRGLKQHERLCLDKGDNQRRA